MLITENGRLVEVLETGVAYLEISDVFNSAFLAYYSVPFGQDFGFRPYVVYTIEDLNRNLASDIIAYPWHARSRLVSLAVYEVFFMTESDKFYVCHNSITTEKMKINVRWTVLDMPVNGDTL